VRLLICGGPGVGPVAKELESYLTAQGYQILVAETAEAAVELARSQKPQLAFIPSRIDQADATLSLMQNLSIVGVPSVLINGHAATYRAADDAGLAQVLSRFARRGTENGNGYRH
jgi:hypothetical protein